MPCWGSARRAEQRGDAVAAARSIGMRRETEQLGQGNQVTRPTTGCTGSTLFWTYDIWFDDV